ncbi:MAG: NAD(P)-dependent oxidoreductase [Bacteroidetes bacterium QS_8_64_10]|nr:MAG: NAD(P)-dependent oxidoreductase [Bacteroidetes bacterium QS_8_64_10]
MNERISIMGCGWLGRPLGRRLLNDGYVVRGSTTTPDKRPRLRDDGLQPHLITLEPELHASDDADEFFDADWLFLNVPPPRGRNDVVAYHRTQIEAVARAARNAPVESVLFASSTGVYPNTNGEVTEDDAGDPARPTGEALLAAEALLQNESGFDATVLRFSGLYGPDRSPARFLAGREDVDGPDAPVNLVHRDDCIGVVRRVLERNARGEVFNVCADKHPTRRAFYTQAARSLDLEPPSFSDTPKPYKVVSNQRLRERLGYRFQHPDPLADVR